MLASIHPLGERARHSRWWSTALAYASGSVAGGAALGAVAGLRGRVAGIAVPPLSPSLTPAMVTVVCAAAVIADVLGRDRLPSWHRQVNEDWLHRYRGWVYGAGYGVQLGLGVVTIVTTATVYAVAALAFLSGSPATGALIGACFGLLRAAPVRGLFRVAGTDRLRRLHERLDALATPVARLTPPALAVVAATMWVSR